MIKIHVDTGFIMVDHDCEGKKEEQIADELILAIDILCADLFVNNPLLNNEEKVKNALATRNNILEHMKNLDYSCKEYFEDED